MANTKYTGCIYLATNISNGKAYIGKTKHSLSARKAGHMASAKRGVKAVFAAAIRKYGPDGFNWAALYRKNPLRKCAPPKLVKN